MPSSSNKFISWSESIDALELINPRAFDYYYHFHSMHGLRDRNLSPLGRLIGIGDYCESTGDSLTNDFLSAIADHFSLDESDMDSYCMSDEGFHFV